ncbi:MAG: ArsA family ATPase [Candidatus Omnitrophica bacterium]|nr:ArsA family ATPase [Candidatus Omnitrophota bacterium]
MALTGLKNDSLKLILFGGKGGVGKTTCAAGAGIYLSEYFKTLLFSTDPAHSLSDSLGQKIGPEIKALKEIKNLSVLEVSAEIALSKFKIEYEAQIKKILDTSTYLDQEDIDSIFALPIPGMDEVMGFKTIVDLTESGGFDKYIVDTAPTGHALRLLNLPELLDEWIKVMAKMRWKYRYMVETFAGSYRPDEGDDFLVSMKKTVKKIENLLKDKNKCEFIAVTIPEDMAILETERLVNNLRKYGIKVRQLIINNVVEDRDCAFCRERKKEQSGYINKIRKKFADLETTVIVLQPHEVKGMDELNRFSKLLFG